MTWLTHFVAYVVGVLSALLGVALGTGIKRADRAAGITQDLQGDHARRTDR